MLHIFFQSVRLIFAALCIYALWILTPVTSELRLTPFYYEAAIENSVLTKLQGAEWVLLGLTFFVLSVIGFHCIFWRVIRNKSKLLIDSKRNIFLKSIDYIWYFGGLVSVLMAIAGLNAREAHRYLEEIEGRKENLETDASALVYGSSESCKTLQTASSRNFVKDEEEDDDEHAEYMLAYDSDFDFFRLLCDYTEQGNYRQVVLSCAEHSESWGWGRNEPTYWQSQFNMEGVADALNHMESICAFTGRIEYLSNRGIMYEGAATRFFNTKDKTNPTWLVLFPIIVAFRTVKTTAEISDAMT